MFAPDTFKDKVAVITGGGSGIGFAIARNLVRLGATVVLVSRKEERLREAAQSLNEEAGREASTFHALDVRDSDAVQVMADEVVGRHGQIDLLVNNAAGNFIVPAEELTPNGWNAVVGIVLNGTFYCSSSVGKKLIEAKRGGAILNVVANYAWTGAAGVVHSASAKAGVIAMTQTLAVEWARHGIRVNAIAPGPVATDGASSKLFPDERVQEGIRHTVPLRRFATLEEIANAAAYMLSDHASYVTGEVFVIDGGQWLSGADYWGRVKAMMR